MIGVTVTFKADDLKKLVRKLPVELPESLGEAGYKYTQGVSKSLRLAAITDPHRPLTPNRRMAASRIVAKKLSKFRSQIMMPQSLIYLDGMKPHYVSLKRGRKITKWVKNNFGNATVSTLSRVTKTKGKAIKGQLYVIPHPFIQKTLIKHRNKLPNQLRGALKKAISASR